MSMTYWGKPIDEALDIHLHGRLIPTDASHKTLAVDSWARWPAQYCKAMLKLVPIVSAAQANELLTAKMATAWVSSRGNCMHPWVIRYVLADLKKHLEQSAGGSESSSGEMQGKTAPPTSHGCLGGEEQLGGRPKKTRRGKRAHGKRNK